MCGGEEAGGLKERVVAEGCAGRACECGECRFGGEEHGARGVVERGECLGIGEGSGE